MGHVDRMKVARLSWLALVLGTLRVSAGDTAVGSPSSFNLKWTPKTGPLLKLYLGGSVRHKVEQTNEKQTQAV
jgi:hypothetical protein